MENTNLKFKVSAPGKVILHGEHSVVYGKPAIASAISMRNQLLFKENTTEEVILSLKDLDLGIKFNVDTLNNLYLSLRTCQESASNSDHSALLRVLEEFILQKLEISTEHKTKFNTTLAVLYLMCGIFLDKDVDKFRHGFSLELQSGVTIGAGLGSSASFAVCVATAFYVLSRGKQLTANTLTSKAREFISKWAFNSEKIMHGNPSGVDNTICTFGGIVKFTKGLPMRQLNIHCNLSILLVDSRVSRSTAKMLEKVAQLKQEFPTLVDHILAAFGECVEQATCVYEDESMKIDTIIEKLTKLFEINNGLLRTLGISHCKLEEIFLIAEKHGLASKITGAGGGGYAIILLPNDYKELKEYQYLCNDLNKANFGWKEVTIGASGVSVDMLND